MEATTLNTIVGIIGIVVGIIGAIVGIVGWNSLKATTEIKNKVKAGKCSTVNQGNTYNYGISEDTVRLIAKDMTKEEMCQLIIRLIPIHTDNENCIGNRLRSGSVTAQNFHKILDEIPTIYYGKNPPPDFSKLKDGSFWFGIE